MHYKLASLLSTSSQKADISSEVFISQPDANKENLAGRLFMVIEVDSSRVVALKIINFLIDALNHNYYQSEKIILRERISTLKVEHIFETALAKTNKDLFEFFKTEKIKINPGALNIAVGVIYENQLHFSIAGKNKALLIYQEKEDKQKTSPKKKHEIEIGAPKYKIADIGKSDYENKKPKELTKIFSDVMSGSIPQKGYFFFANEALSEYLSGKQIIEIITKLPPVSAAEQIKKTLEQVNAYISFAGIIIKNTQGLAQGPIQKQDVIREEQKREDPLDALNSTEHNTEKLLAPSGLIDFKKISGIISNTFSRLKIGSKKANSKIFDIKEKMFVQKQRSPITFRKISEPIKNFFIYIVNACVWVYRTLTNKNKLKNAGEKIKQSPQIAREKSQKGMGWIKSLNQKNKILLSTAGGLIVIFVISIAITGYVNNKKEQGEIFDNLIASIEQKQNQIEANLLYGNEDNAKKLLRENSELIYQLTQNTKDNDEDLKIFQTKHEEQLEKIRRFVVIENPKEIADFSKLNSQAEAKNLIFGNEKIYSGDSSQKTVYSIDLENELVTAIADLGIAISELSFPAIGRDGKLYFINNTSLTELNTENQEMKNVSLALPGSRQDISGMESYNNRLYLLDNNNNQIYRLISDENGFTKRDPWVQSSADFSQSSDLAIDGYIYVLNKDGNILKFLSGEEESFLLDQIEPALSQANRLMVSDQEDGYIYILESTTNRLVVFKKNGNFILQYRSDQLQDVRDFAINEQAKKIYILNGNQVYEVDGKHFD